MMVRNQKHCKPCIKKRLGEIHQNENVCMRLNVLKVTFLVLDFLLIHQIHFRNLKNNPFLQEIKNDLQD